MLSYAGRLPDLPQLRVHQVRLRRAYQAPLSGSRSANLRSALSCESVILISRPGACARSCTPPAGPAADPEQCRERHGDAAAKPRPTRQWMKTAWSACICSSTQLVASSSRAAGPARGSPPRATSCSPIPARSYSTEQVATASALHVKDGGDRRACPAVRGYAHGIRTAHRERRRHPEQVGLTLR